MDNQQGNVLDNIAYSVGFLLGDGCLFANPYNGDYRVQWATMDVECLERVKEEVATERPIKPIAGKNCSLLSIYSKEVWQQWVDLTEFKKVVPAYYLQEASPEVALDVIAGMLDSDGSIKERKVKKPSKKLGTKEYWVYELRFYNNEIELINGFCRLCKIAHVRTTNIREYVTQSGRIGYDVGVVLRDFAVRGGYFHCKRKQQRLDDYRANIKQKRR